MSDQIVAEDVWAADMLYGSEPSSAPPTESHDDDVVAESARASAGSEVCGESFEFESASRHEPEADVNAGAKRTAIALGAGVACAVAVTAAVLMMFRDTAPAPQPSAPPPVLVAAPPPQPAWAPAAESDQAIAYTASANCPTGSPTLRPVHNDSAVHRLSTESHTHQRHSASAECRIRLSMATSSRRGGEHRSVRAEFAAVTQQCPEHVDEATGQG